MPTPVSVRAASLSGVDFTIGTQTRGNAADITELTHTGSLIGSTEGRVDIVAGGDVAIAGSDVLSTAGIGITGENVKIYRRSVRAGSAAWGIG